MKIGPLKELVLLGNDDKANFSPPMIILNMTADGCYEYLAAANQLVLEGILMDDPEKLVNPDRLVFFMTPKGVQAHRDLATKKLAQAVAA